MPKIMDIESIKQLLKKIKKTSISDPMLALHLEDILHNLKETSM